MSLSAPAKTKDSSAASSLLGESSSKQGSKSKSTIKSLTSLRFLAAALLVFYHLGQSELAKASPAFFQFLGSCALDQGVSFFFVLSGFILHYSYPALNSRGDVRRFLLARFGRIWPAHIAALALFCLLGSELWLPHNARFPWITAANITLLHAWIPQVRCFFSLNAPSWSISTEWFFYLAFPFLVQNWRATGRVKLLGAGFLTICVLALCYGLHLHGTRTPIANVYHGWIYINPLCRLFEFVLGMSVAAFFMQWRDKPLSYARASLFECLVLAIAAFNLYLMPRLLGADHAASLNPIVHWLDHSGGALIYAALILIFSFQKGCVSRLFSLAPMVFLGEISYSVYLVHWVVLQYMQARAQELQAVAVWFGCAAYWIAVLAIATAIYMCVEKPARNLVRTWTRKSA